MAADLAFSDSAATSVGAAFGAYAADDAAKSGKEAAYVYGKAAITQLYDPPPPNGLKWQPELGTSSRGGDFGFTVGSPGRALSIRARHRRTRRPLGITSRSGVATRMASGAM
jgi:hypothetical protein